MTRSPWYQKFDGTDTEVYINPAHVESVQPAIGQNNAPLIGYVAVLMASGRINVIRGTAEGVAAALSLGLEE